MRREDAVVGATAGWWTIIEPPFVSNRRTRVKVRCRCGTEAIRRVDSLYPTTHKGNPSTRCRPCASRHSSTNIDDLRSAHPLYDTWRSMITRCHRPMSSAPNWRYYGARGISVCERWREGKEAFWRFVSDVGERPEGCTLDRIDFDGDYEPGNVRWATATEQNENRRISTESGPF